jgi:transcriptional antiterminator RfaH
MMSNPDLCWLLLYTKPRCESWADINLRKQGYSTLLPRVRRGSGFAPLFPRYLFVGHTPDQPERPLHSTRGVLYVVRCGDHPARVPADVVGEVRSRMDARGVVTVDASPARDSLFAKAERDRIRTLEKFARAGFRVVAA